MRNDKKKGRHYFPLSNQQQQQNRAQRKRRFRVLDTRSGHESWQAAVAADMRAGTVGGGRTAHLAKGVDVKAKNMRATRGAHLLAWCIFFCSHYLSWRSYSACESHEMCVGSPASEPPCALPPLPAILLIALRPPRCRCVCCLPCFRPLTSSPFPSRLVCLCVWLCVCLSV